MDGLSHLPPQLTKLYADTKRSCDAVTDPGKVENVPELISLHRKFRIQNDRLTAWAIEWSEQTAATQTGNTDDSLSSNGLPDRVTSVLNNIKEIFDEAETIRCSGRRGSASEEDYKSMAPIVLGANRQWELADKSRYEELVKDLATAIDTLYVMSRARNVALSKRKSSAEKPQFPSMKRSTQGSETRLSVRGSSVESPPTSPHLTPSQTMSSRATTVFTRASVSSSFRSSMSSLGAAEALPKIDPTLLSLSAEEPPPYETTGYSSAPRVMGHFRQRNPGNKLGRSGGGAYTMVPVLIEYAQYDSFFKEASTQPPLYRLETLLDLLKWTPETSDPSPVGSLSCRGYIEDAEKSRYGIVYELPSFVYSGPESKKTLEDMKPASLLNLLHSATNSSVTLAQRPVPALESRFRLAFGIANLYSRLLDFDAMHKDINSGNILVFKHAEKPPSENGLSAYNFAIPYFCGFDLFSEFQIDSCKENVHHLSRHPDDPRNGSKDSDYTYGFDMYSLGLVLLEIGLWAPLSELYKPKYTGADFKKRIENIWVEKLVPKCGTLFTRAVKNCIEFQDLYPKEVSEGTQARLVYDEVLAQLRRCCLLDECEPLNPTASVPSISLPPNTPSLHSSLEPQSASKQYHNEETASLAKTDSATESIKSKIPGFLRRKLKADSRSSSQESDSKPRSLYSLISKHASFQSLAEEDDHRSRKSATPTQSEPDLSTLYRDAVGIIQRAWRTHRDHRSYKDYRRKVIIIQVQWRKRKVKISQNANTSTIEIPLSDDRNSGPFSGSYDASYVNSDFGTLSPRAKPRLRLYPVKLPQAKLDQWHHEMLPQLERILKKALRELPESISVDLVSIGDSHVTARPTILITCSSTRVVRAAIQKKFLYDKKEFDLKVKSGKVRRSKVTKRRRTPMPVRSVRGAPDADIHALNPLHQKRPLCGASIGAYDNDHLPPVSYGGVVLVDGQPYGMSVHHLLDAPSDDEECDVVEESDSYNAIRSSSFEERYTSQPVDDDTNHSDYLEISDDEGYDSFSESESYYHHDNVSSNNYNSDSDSDDGSDGEFAGDIEGVKVNGKKEIAVTQPAIDDVSDHFFPNVEGRADDHLSSHRLGHIHASSGIKRCVRNNVVHEVDWSLFKLDEDRLQPYNVVPGGKRYFKKARQPTFIELRHPVCRINYGPEEDEYPSETANSEDLGGLRVHCLGRTSGLRGGVVGRAMSLVRIYQRKTFSRSWHVVGGFGGMSILYTYLP